MEIPSNRESCHTIANRLLNELESADIEHNLRWDSQEEYFIHDDEHAYEKLLARMETLEKTFQEMNNMRVIDTKINDLKNG